MRFLKICIVQFLLFLVFPSSAHAISSVLINEVSVHPSANTPEWIELYNPNHVTIADYWIDDDTDFVNDSGSSSKKSLATLLSDETYPVLEVNSVFNNGGDVVVLFDKNGTIIDTYQYTEDPGENMSLGRFPNGTGQMQQLVSMTKGLVNSGLLPSPTPTPEPTEPPTKTPVPTKTPTPAKVTKSVTTDDENLSTTKNSLPTISKKKLATINKDPLATLSGLPTSVLTASESVKKKNAPNLKKVLVKDSQFSLNGLSFAIGGIFILSCGILLYLRKRRSNYE